ncbi:WSC domain-containing protein [Pterulicium gracile]|uniref:WSC domain-containing protein n=1 Tax=Pterulicium gracile TaxID=1884261 RepID=A0A5C3QS69_9AGAR|nr:WSC domain-containing protein [Pterula gracilis]
MFSKALRLAVLLHFVLTQIVLASPASAASSSIPPLEVWRSDGCLNDPNDARQLSFRAQPSMINEDGMTIEVCRAFCQSNKFKYAGVEFARECWCENKIRDPRSEAPAGACSMACTGDSKKTCGGANAIEIQHRVL